MRHFIASVFFFLLTFPQAHACLGPSLEFTLFFETIPNPQPDADVIAKVSLSDMNDGAATVTIVELFKTSDQRVHQGDKIVMKFMDTSCGPYRRHGDKGTIIAKVGVDIEDRLVLCAYTRRFQDGMLYPPSVNECAPSKIEAAKRVKFAAEQGDAKAQTDLGKMYEEGKNVRKNEVEAVKWYGLAARQGYARAQFLLGIMYQKGQGVQQSEEEAVKWYSRAAEQGDEGAKKALGTMTKTKLLISAAEGGDAQAQYELGHNYQYGYSGVEENGAEAVKWFKLAAAQGYVRAMRELGWIYQNGWKVPRNDTEAAKWYRLGAERGDAESQRELGRMYALGHGDEPSHDSKWNEAKAAEWYRRAAEQGYGWGQVDLGRMYEFGYGVRQNHAEAVKWYRKAAEQGHDTGQYELARMYLTGQGVKQDEEEALKWFRLTSLGVGKDMVETLEKRKSLKIAAERGDAQAQYELGATYLQRHALLESDAEAVKWFKKSAEQGYEKAQSALKQMQNK